MVPLLRYSIPKKFRRKRMLALGLRLVLYFTEKFITQNHFPINSDKNHHRCGEGYVGY